MKQEYSHSYKHYQCKMPSQHYHINTTGPAATQNSGLHRSLPYVCIALLHCSLSVVLYFNVFFCLL